MIARARLRPIWILGAAWCLGIAYAFPGYLNWDSGIQLAQARAGWLGDWHPPLMAAYWRVIDVIIAGPILMLVMQTALFLWGLHALLRERLAPTPAAIAAAALFLFPPILTPMAAVWKDAQMAGFLIAGTMLALRPRWSVRIAGLALLVLAAGVRDNGGAALPPLCVLISCRWVTWSPVRAIAAGLALAVALTGTAMLANETLTDEHDHAWYRTVAIQDLAGTICNAAPMSDDEVRAALDGVQLLPTHDLQHAMCDAYNPRVWFSLSFGDHAVFMQVPDERERAARAAAWRRLLREQPGAYLAHRTEVTAELLGLTDEEMWEPVCQTFGANDGHLAAISHRATYSGLQRALGDAFRWLGTTILYRPWAYLVLALVLLGYGLIRDRLVAAFVASGLLYEASFFIGTSAPDFRYSHWMITCTCAGAVLVATERARAARARVSRA